LARIQSGSKPRTLKIVVPLLYCVSSYWYNYCSLGTVLRSGESVYDLYRYLAVMVVDPMDGLGCVDFEIFVIDISLTSLGCCET
jgi:hypothetical protein